jgi:glutamate-5-semialdehyde dehydrogenase
VTTSLDRKVCNTLNVCAIVRSHAASLVPAFLAGLDAAAGERGVSARLHVVAGSENAVSDEYAATLIDVEGLAIEWEWEHSPEVTLVIVDSIEEAAELCNRYSPHFVASLISDDPAEHDRFYAVVDAPFVGNGFTRWVDGQYALNAPELGLSNWQAGRALGRGAILSGDSVHTLRYRAVVTDHSVRR